MSRLRVKGYFTLKHYLEGKLIQEVRSANGLTKWGAQYIMNLMWALGAGDTFFMGLIEGPLSSITLSRLDETGHVGSDSPPIPPFDGHPGWSEAVDGRISVSFTGVMKDSELTNARKGETGVGNTFDFSSSGSIGGAYLSIAEDPTPSPMSSVADDIYVHTKLPVAIPYVNGSKIQASYTVQMFDTKFWAGPYTEVQSNNHSSTAP